MMNKGVDQGGDVHIKSSLKQIGEKVREKKRRMYGGFMGKSYMMC